MSRRAFSKKRLGKSKQLGMASLDPFEKWRRAYKALIDNAEAKKAGPVRKKPDA